jgi:hypothetical protein
MRQRRADRLRREARRCLSLARAGRERHHHNSRPGPFWAPVVVCSSRQPCSLVPPFPRIARTFLSENRARRDRVTSHRRSGPAGV